MGGNSMPGDVYGKYIARVAVLLVFAAVFLAFSNPMPTGDAWWHLNSGRWIVEKGMLPSVDHFTHTASPEPSLNKTFVLQSYWLSQSLMYMTYKVAGFHGLVLAKATVFTLIFFMLHLCLRSGGLGVAASAAVVAPVAMMLRLFSEMRPQIFSFLMCITVFYLLERTREMEGRGRKLLPLLPLSLVLWSNLHGGFIIGMGMVGIYLLVETLRVVIHGEGPEVGNFFVRALWLLGSILAAGMNPGGFKALQVTFMQIGQAHYEKIIDEYLPTLEFARMSGDQFLQAGFVVLAAVAVLVLLLSWRRLRLDHLLLFVIFGYAGFTYFRFSAFFALIAVAVAGRYAEGLVPDRLSTGTLPVWARHGAALAVALLAVAFALRSDTILNGAINSKQTPRKAVSIIREWGPPQEIFNPYEWGGYMGWWLNPEYRVFVDSRLIDPEVQEDYHRAKSGDLGVLKEYGVNTVVFYNLNSIRTGSRVPGVVLALLNDPSWGLMYYDQLSSIFVRKSSIERGKLMVLGKELLWDLIEELLAYWAKTEPSDHRAHAEVGALYAARGMRQKALESLKRSLAIKPGNAEAARVLNKYGINPNAEH